MESLVVQATTTPQPIAAGSLAELSADVAYNPSDDTYVVVWEQEVTEDNHDIYARLLTNEGIPAAPAVAVATTSAYEGRPAIVYIPAEPSFLVVWQAPGVETELDLQGRLLRPDAVPLAPAFTVAALPFTDRNPDLAYNPASHQVVVVWEHFNGELATPHMDVLGQRVTFSGTLDGGPIMIATTADDEYDPAVAVHSGSGTAVVAWHTFNGGNADVWAQRVDQTGSLVASPFSVIGWEQDQVVPDIAFNPDADEFLVVWEDHHWQVGWTIFDWDIYGQRLAADGTPLGSAFPVASDGDLPRSAPRVTYKAASHEYGVAWEHRAALGDYDVDWRTVAANGSLPAPELAVSDLSSFEGQPAIAADPRTGFLVVWEDGAGGGSDVFGMVVHRAVLAGRVFDGEVGDRTHPLSGVTVELYCSDFFPLLGTLVASTTTDTQGWFGLSTASSCSFYNIKEVDPPGYTSVGALSAGGTVTSPTIIQHAAPLVGKVLSGNEFWDVGADPPPGGWTSFSPTTWLTTTQSPSCAVQVSDVGTGLDPTTAQYAFSTNAGATWSAWAAASCNATPGAPGPAWITTTYIPFGQDSGATGLNRVRFRILDLGGHQGTSPDYQVRIDTTPPFSPSTITFDRPVGVWSSDPTGIMTWSAGYDETSGVAGYSVEWKAYSGNLPDGTPETAGTHLDERIPYDYDSWYYTVRAIDAAGNLAAAASEAGPFKLDMSPPNSPLVTCSHQPGQWSTDNTVTCSWSTPYDGGSGVAGYSLVWDQELSTDPDATIDTTGTSVTSAPLADSAWWYFHVRAVDGVGLLSHTETEGRFKIDTTPPASAVTALAPYQGTLSFAVTWTGNAGSGSPIASYDVQVTDNGVTSTWKSATTATSDTFTGQLGHVYSFSSRARDQAGNLETYPQSADASTQVGRVLLLTVKNESGAVCPGARVFVNQAYHGKTGAGGTISSPYLLPGDKLTTLHQVHEQPSKKQHHQGHDASNWAWRVYLTNVAIAPTSGDPQIPIVTSLDSPTMDLTVRKIHTLIGFHMLVGVEWDASAAYLADLKTGVASASDFLYDGGDGQMFWELIEIVDDRTIWDHVDQRMHASNKEWPHVPWPWGIEATGDPIMLGRYFNGKSSNSGSWSAATGYRGMIHEFGHYFGLLDEYLTWLGVKEPGAHCAENFHASPEIIPESRRASIMYYQYEATEFCSSVDPQHFHRGGTMQAVWNGNSCWGTIKDVFKDRTGAGRWTLRSPDDRGDIVTGPTAIPVAAWRQVEVTNHNRGACAPLSQHVTWRGTSTPIEGCDVWVRRTGKPDLYQGQTDKSGNISVLGAANGDRLELSVIGGSSTSTISCSPGPASALVNTATTAELDPDPFDLEVSAQPLSATEMEVAVTASVTLAGAPGVTVSQDGADEVAVTLTWDGGAGRWVGTAVLSTATAPRGYLRVEAGDTQGGVVVQHRRFAFAAVPATAPFTHLMAGDGRFELVLNEGSLATDTIVSIHPTTNGSDSQGTLQRVGESFVVTTVPLVAALGAPAAVNMRYVDEQVTEVDPETLRVHRWDEGTQQWVSLGGTVDDALHMASAFTDRISTFALLGERLCPKGDVNGDCVVNVADVFHTINALFAGGPAVGAEGDVNADGHVDVGDIFYLINFLFAGGPAPV